MYGPPVDMSFINLSSVTGALCAQPRVGLRPLRRNSKGKYLSHAFRLNNNNISDVVGLEYTLDHFLAQPSKLGWLDLSFNKITLIDPALCQLHELRVLYLHGNSICDLSQTDKLGELQYLHTITLHGNVIEFERGYRQHVIAVLPHLKKMDFSAVTHEQRALANIWGHCTKRGKKGQIPETVTPCSHEH
ncbi:Leucine-rich repeat-containing protein 51 [Larimichthys crocea]|uniref:Leucine-rich repeat-containing protein 51 n=1 Tax=Larimichthys crocea TaxID=215358 RepID=A0A6G0HXN5_LARCR|nr:Leucine-rich repeat-containing protein 51 [Larimichthys crocea]